MKAMVRWGGAFVYDRTRESREIELHAENLGNDHYFFLRQPVEFHRLFFLSLFRLGELKASLQANWIRQISNAAAPVESKCWQLWQMQWSVRPWIEWLSGHVVAQCVRFGVEMWPKSIWIVLSVSKRKTWFHSYELVAVSTLPLPSSSSSNELDEKSKSIEVHSTKCRLSWNCVVCVVVSVVCLRLEAAKWVQYTGCHFSMEMISLTHSHEMCVPEHKCSP